MAGCRRAAAGLVVVLAAAPLLSCTSADEVGVAPAAVESLCVHGDSPGALANARAVRAALEGAGVRLATATATAKGRARTSRGWR